MPFEIFEKLDGSLITLYWHDGAWRAATKGSFASSQAAWAAEWLSRCDLSALVPGTTYLTEAIYPENRIVIRYERSGLTLLAAYAEDGLELSYDELADVAGALDWPLARRHPASSLSELAAHVRELPATAEGFVLRFANGHRLKIKGDEYLRIHRLVSNVTPLALWAALQADDDMAAIRRDLPEEFWDDFDRISLLLNQRAETLIADVAKTCADLASLSDKEVGLRLAEIPDPARRFVFSYRKSNGDLLSGRMRQALFREIRPQGNRLEGYMPSAAINRIQDDAM